MDHSRQMCVVLGVMEALVCPQEVAINYYFFSVTVFQVSDSRR
jgi:hypothetical protein